MFFVGGAKKNICDRFVSVNKVPYLCSPKKSFLYKINIEMKEGIHPKNYRFVVFQDMSNGYSFLTRSTVASKETIKWEDGNEYPLVKLEISNTSHPFYTGKVKLVDTAGRVDKFYNRYKNRIKK